MIKNYATIDKLFGAPLSTVPQLNVPFKLKGWQVVGIIFVSACAVYGVYAAQRDILKHFRTAHFQEPKD